MTVICGGGTSSFKPIFAPAVYVAPATLGSLLNNVPVAWAVPLAAYLGAKTYDLATFCTIDPPADPGFTALDAIALLNVYNPVAFGPAAAKLQQLIDRFAWYQFCKCDSVATPAAPAPPAAPAGLPVINPTSVVNLPIASPCKQQANLSPHTLPVSNSVISDHIILGLLNATSVRMTASTVTTVGPGRPCAMNWEFDSASATLLNICHPMGVNATFQQDVAIPAGTTQIYVSIFDDATCAGGVGSGSGTTTVTFNTQLFCDGQAPGQTTTPCCPPDAFTQATLDQVLQTVRLIQRQIVPFAYVTGNVHAGLTGTGSFAIQGLLGVKVALTVDPASLSVSAGTPAQLFDRGFVTLGTPDGYPSDYRLEHNPTIILPPRCSAFTTLGYTLHPGVTATITELLREP